MPMSLAWVLKRDIIKLEFQHLLSRYHEQGASALVCPIMGWKIPAGEGAENRHSLSKFHSGSSPLVEIVDNLFEGLLPPPQAAENDLIVANTVSDGNCLVDAFITSAFANKKIAPGTWYQCSCWMCSNMFKHLPIARSIRRVPWTSVRQAKKKEEQLRLCRKLGVDWVVPWLDISVLLMFYQWLYPPSMASWGQQLCQRIVGVFLYRWFSANRIRGECGQVVFENETSTCVGWHSFVTWIGLCFPGGCSCSHGWNHGIGGPKPHARCCWWLWAPYLH